MGTRKPETRGKNPEGKPDFFATRTRLLLPDCIKPDETRGKNPENPKPGGKTRLFWYPNPTRTREMIPEPDPNPTFATRTHHYARRPRLHFPKSPNQRCWVTKPSLTVRCT